MEEKNYEIPFGKKMQFGNFTVLKFNKTLSGKRMKELREGLGMMPKSERGKLKRAGIPYIKIEAISGIWAIEFACNTFMYRQVEFMASLAAKEEVPGSSTANLVHLCDMFFTDTTIHGDEEYYIDKAKALKGFMERHAKAASDETDEEKAADDKILEEVKADEEAKTAIKDMAEELKKEEGV